MKLIKNILASVAAVLAVASCTIQPEDTFSTAPVAPVMSMHNDILITTATVEEDVTFVWEKARFIDTEAYVYDLYLTMGETDVLLANDVENTYYTLSKTDFRTFMKENFELEQNTTHPVSARVEIADAAGEVYASAPITFNVYVYDDAVPSVLSAEIEEVVLDMTTPSAEIDLLSWDEPRLVYGEDVTYKVTLKVGEGEESVLLEGSYDMSYTTTVDALNEAVIAAGGAENAEVDVNFYVYACCPTIPDGVPSNAVTVKVTTYMATFSEQYYLPGSYQDWKPATAAVLTVSSKTKGLYQGFVDLTTADGNDVEFKFCPTTSFDNGGDFGFSDVTVTTYADKYSAATAKTTSSDNIKVPSGFYYVKLNKKFNTLDMVQLDYLELIGGFSGDYANWAKGLKMTYDPTSKSWTAEENIEIANGTEFKVRFNSDWTYSFGVDKDKDVLEFGGNPGNITFAKKDGTYKMILNASTSDLSLNAVDVNMPDYLVVAGDYSGHSWSPTDDMRVNLVDDSKGLYCGYITMYDATDGFKFVKSGVWMGHTAVDNLVYTLQEDGGENCAIANGTYCWNVDIINMTATATPITKVGIIGSFEGSGWGSDVEMTFDPETLTYSVEQTFAENDKWKFRFNGDWAYNLGGDLSALSHNGGDIIQEVAGTYVITLDMAHGSFPTCTCVAK